MRKTRTLLAVAAAITGLVAIAGPAQAAPPQAQPFTVLLEGTDTAGDNGFCPFPVLIEGVTNQLSPHDTPGNVFTGFVSATVTNTDTGKTLKFNVSGPGTITNFPDGAFALDVKGPNLLWTTVANSFPGVPQLAYTNGHVRVSVAASGLTTSYELNGRSTDVCAALS